MQSLLHYWELMTLVSVEIGWSSGARHFPCKQVDDELCLKGVLQL